MKINEIRIDGNSVEEIVSKSFSYNDRINQRTICNFSVINPEFSIEVGMEVQIYIKSEFEPPEYFAHVGSAKVGIARLGYVEQCLLFRGTIDSYELRGDFDTIYDVSCVDNSQKIDRRIVIEAFENVSAGDIVKDLISNIFSDEGITEGIIDDGPVIKGSVFNYIDGNISMNLISESTGYIWYVDADNKLNFKEPSANISSIELSDINKNYFDFRLRKTRAKYRNRQYTQTGLVPTGKLPIETPSPRPDGSSRTFTLQLPIAKKPRIFVNDTEVNPDDIGVTGLDVNRKWYFSYASPTITQDFSQPILDSDNGDTVKVEYQGLLNNIIYSDDEEEITARQAIEGGTGLYERADERKGINDEESALEHTIAMLRKYGNISGEVTFNTFETDLRAGELVKIVNTDKGINDFYLIESINMRGDAYNLLFTVKALEGEGVGNWVDFFKDLVVSSKELSIRPDDLLIRIHNIAESFEIVESMEYTVFACSVPAEDLYPSTTLYPC